MAFFRKKMIFQVDEALPDPEELKFRFRRRLLILTLLSALCLLGFPVLRELRPYFLAKTKTRHFTQIILDSRLLSAQKRTTVALEMDPKDPHRWIRSFHEKNSHCEEESTAPSEILWTEEVHWELRYQPEGSADVHATTKLCFHPVLGLLIDGVALAQGKLLISGYPEDDDSQSKRSAKLLLTSAGDEINFLSE